MTELCHSIEEGLSQGHVYDMNDIWKSYAKRSQELRKEIPRRYESMKRSFYEDVKNL